MRPLWRPACGAAAHGSDHRLVPDAAPGANSSLGRAVLPGKVALRGNANAQGESGSPRFFFAAEVSVEFARHESVAKVHVLSQLLSFYAEFGSRSKSKMQANSAKAPRRKKGASEPSP